MMNDYFMAEVKFEVVGCNFRQKTYVRACVNGFDVSIFLFELLAAELQMEGRTHNVMSQR